MKHFNRKYQQNTRREELIDIRGQHDIARLFLFFNLVAIVLMLVELVFTSNYILWVLIYLVYHLSFVIPLLTRKDPRREALELYDDCLVYTVTTIALYFAALR